MGASILPLAGKRPATKTLLMDAGERLIGRCGVDGVTLREIAEVAGQSNRNVVQYHYGDKKGLILAILRDRTERLEALRQERLEALKARGAQHDVRELLAILLLPSLTFRDEEGGYVFTRFQLQCWLQPEFMDRRPTAERYQGSVLAEIVHLLRESCSALPWEVLSRRLSALSLMFLSCVVEFDNARPHPEGAGEFDPEPLLDMAVAALSRPGTPDLKN